MPSRVRALLEAAAFGALAVQLGPFFPIWASATVDEILSALHERIVVGSLGRHISQRT